MAVDWVKMRTDLYRDAKVSLMADSLLLESGELARYVSHLEMRDMTVTRNVMRNVTVGALVTVWGSVRHRGKRNGDDLVLRGMTTRVIDDMADLPGFGTAMIAAGWARETGTGLVFPNFFEEFNVDPEGETKKKNAERQRRYREKTKQKSDVTVTSRNALEESRDEESREETNNTHTHRAERAKKQEPAIPDVMQSDGFPEAWQRWLKWVESTQPKPVDPIRQESLLMELGNRGPAKAARDIEFSIQRDAKSILDSDHDFQKRQTAEQPQKKKIQW